MAPKELASNVRRRNEFECQGPKAILTDCSNVINTELVPPKAFAGQRVAGGLRSTVVKGDHLILAPSSFSTTAPIPNPYFHVQRTPNGQPMDSQWTPNGHPHTAMNRATRDGDQRLINMLNKLLICNAHALSLFAGVHWVSIGSPLGVHWMSIGSPL